MCVGWERLDVTLTGFALSITFLEGVFLKTEIWDSYSAFYFQNVRLDVKDQIIEQNNKWPSRPTGCGLFLFLDISA